MKKILLTALFSLEISYSTLATQPAYFPKERPYPCIYNVSCTAASEFDPTLVKVSVDYYDDLGTTFHWKGQLHRQEGRTDCNQAMRDHFPYAFFKMCESVK